MNINEASDFFNSLINETTKKSEIKIYADFRGILSALKKRDLTEEDLRSIDKKLTNLDLKANPNKKKKYLKRRLQEFTSYLNKDFSLITEGYYSTIGIAFGPGFGMIFGLTVLNFIERSLGLTYGMMGGMILGYIIGHYMDTKAEKENRVLKQSDYLKE